MNDLAKYIDHSILKASATTSDIEKLCHEAIQYRFYAVCVNPCHIKLCKNILKDSPVKISTVIGFPLGATLTEAKVYEAMQSMNRGADELDIVINIGLAKSGDWGEVYRDLSDVITATRCVVHKTIIECCYLTHEEKIRAIETCLKAGSKFVKTSTGFGSSGATVEDVRLIREIAGKEVCIKAAGGIKTMADAMRMIEAGATRIGTSSGAEIVS